MDKIATIVLGALKILHRQPQKTFIVLCAAQTLFFALFVFFFLWKKNRIYAIEIDLQNTFSLDLFESRLAFTGIALSLIFIFSLFLSMLFVSFSSFILRSLNVGQPSEAAPHSRSDVEKRHTAAFTDCIATRYSTDSFDGFNAGRDLSGLSLEIWDELEQHTDILRWFRKNISKKIQSLKWAEDCIIYLFGSSVHPNKKDIIGPRDHDICICLYGRNAPIKIPSPFLGTFKSDKGAPLIEALVTEFLHMEDALLHGDPFYHSVVRGQVLAGSARVDALLKRLAYRVVVPHDEYVDFLQTRADAGLVSLQNLPEHGVHATETARVAYIAAASEVQLYACKRMGKMFFNHNDFFQLAQRSELESFISDLALTCFSSIVNVYKSRDMSCNKSWMIENAERLRSELRHE